MQVIHKILHSRYVASRGGDAKSRAKVGFDLDPLALCTAKKSSMVPDGTKGNTAETTQAGV